MCPSSSAKQEEELCILLNKTGYTYILTKLSKHLQHTSTLGTSHTSQNKAQDCFSENANNYKLDS